MFIQVTSTLRVNASDGLNFILQRKKGDTYPEIWNNVGYYSNLPDCLHALIIRGYIHDSQDTKDLKEFLTYMKTAIDDMKSVCRGTVTKVSAANLNKYFSFEEDE